MKAIEMAFAVYTVTDLTLSRKFYNEVLGLTETSVWVDEENKGFIEYSFGPDQAYTLAIDTPQPNSQPGKGGAIVSLEVENFEEAIKSLKEHNVKFELETYESSVCHMAIILDLDDNRLMIHKRKV